MCLLTTSTIRTLKSVFLNTQGLINDVYGSNSDGLGVMYSDGLKLHVLKVLPRSAAEARQFIESLPDSDHQIACHWRMKTHGLIDMVNCHPYRVNEETYLAHNGILHTGNKADPEKSDTWHFIKDYLATLPTDALHDAKFLEMVGEFIGNNRFAIMSADGRLSVVNAEQGVETHGIWFSNTYAWSPAMLMPEYRKQYKMYHYGGYGHMLDDGYPGLTKYDSKPTKSTLAEWWPEDDDEGVDLDELAQDVYDIVDSCDEAELSSLLATDAHTVVNIILNEYLVSFYEGSPANLPAYEASIAQAWVEADDAYLVRKAAKDPHSVAQCLLYYCEAEATSTVTTPYGK